MRRGHTAVSVARSVPAERVEHATYIEGTLLDVPGLVAELEGVDVVISTVPARGDMLGKVREGVAELVAALPPTVRIGVVGGAGGSLVAPGGERVIDQPSFTEEYKPRRSRRSTSSRTCSATTTDTTGSTSTPPAASAHGTRGSAPGRTATAAT